MIQGRDIISMLLYEAKRKPHIAELVENAADLTDEDIETANVPLKWFKIALRRYRDTLLITINFDESRVRNGFTPDPEGDIRKWIGSETWINIGRGNQILINHGTLIWTDQECFWMDSIHIRGPHPVLQDGSVFVRKGTRSDYKLAQRERILGNDPMLEHETAAVQRVHPLGFRIY